MVQALDHAMAREEFAGLGIAGGGGEPGVDPGILNVAVSQMICHVLNASAGFQEMDRDRMPQ